MDTISEEPPFLEAYSFGLLQKQIKMLEKFVRFLPFEDQRKEMKALLDSVKMHLGVLRHLQARVIF